MDIVEYMRGFAEDHEPDGWPAVKMSQITALCDEIDRLRAEVAELRRDAERYRWLRDSCGYGYGMGCDTPAECGISFGWQQSEPFESNFSIDAAIDAALAKEQP